MQEARAIGASGPASAVGPEGEVCQGRRQTNTIEVTSGALPLTKLRIAVAGQPHTVLATLNGEVQPIEWAAHDNSLTVQLLGSRTLIAGQMLQLSVEP